MYLVRHSHNGTVNLVFTSRHPGRHRCQLPVIGPVQFRYDFDSERNVSGAVLGQNPHDENEFVYFSTRGNLKLKKYKPYQGTVIVLDSWGEYIDACGGVNPGDDDDQAGGGVEAFERDSEPYEPFGVEPYERAEEPTERFVPEEVVERQVEREEKEADEELEPVEEPPIEPIRMAIPGL